MLEHIMRLYITAMAFDVRSPLPHLFGPPGCGKSTVCEQLADIIGVNLHVINLARLNPLELEGVQMPQGDGDAMKLKLLHATFWTQIKEGDIVLFDEALRAMPEMFDALLDILTSRRVADFAIPRAFFIAASNTTVAYDVALEDRLLHLPVPDIRSKKKEKSKLAKMMVELMGLHPKMVDSPEMLSLIDTEIVPMYAMLDNLGKSGSGVGSITGTSVRKLIGQVRLREIRSKQLLELIEENNRITMRDGKAQFYILVDGKKVDPAYARDVKKLPLNKISEVARINTKVNEELIGLEEARKERGETDDDDGGVDFEIVD